MNSISSGECPTGPAMTWVIFCIISRWIVLHPLERGVNLARFNENVEPRGT